MLQTRGSYIYCIEKKSNRLIHPCPQPMTYASIHPSHPIPLIPPPYLIATSYNPTNPSPETSHYNHILKPSRSQHQLRFVVKRTSIAKNGLFRKSGVEGVETEKNETIQVPVKHM